MHKLFSIPRILLGLIYFVFGLNGFLNFLPMPENLPEGAVAFTTGMMSAKYFFPLLKGTEVLCGAALLANQFVALALVVLAPVTIHIFLFHLFLTPGLENSILPLVMMILSLLIAFSERKKLIPLLRAK